MRSDLGPNETFALCHHAEGKPIEFVKSLPGRDEWAQITSWRKWSQGNIEALDLVEQNQCFPLMVPHSERECGHPKAPSTSRGSFLEIRINVVKIIRSNKLQSKLTNWIKNRSHNQLLTKNCHQTWSLETNFLFSSGIKLANSWSVICEAKHTCNHSFLHGYSQRHGVDTCTSTCPHIRKKTCTKKWWAVGTPTRAGAFAFTSEQQLSYCQSIQARSNRRAAPSDQPCRLDSSPPCVVREVARYDERLFPIIQTKKAGSRIYWRWLELTTQCLACGDEEDKSNVHAACLVLWLSPNPTYDRGGKMKEKLDGRCTFSNTSSDSEQPKDDMHADFAGSHKADEEERKTDHAPHAIMMATIETNLRQWRDVREIDRHGAGSRRPRALGHDNSSDDKDDAPMPDAPLEPELMDLPPVLASARPMSRFKRCIALHLECAAGPR